MAERVEQRSSSPLPNRLQHTSCAVVARSLQQTAGNCIGEPMVSVQFNTSPPLKFLSKQKQTDRKHKRAPMVTVQLCASPLWGDLDKHKKSRAPRVSILDR